MEKLKKLDQLMLFKLTNTILKAASLAMASLQDPNKILALQFKKADLPKEFTKVATQAFNRRLSVMLLASRTDLTKGDSFPIANSQAVLQLLGYNDLKKSAAVLSSAFVFTVNDGQMKKTAAVVQVKPQVLPTIDLVLNKIATAIDKDTITIKNAFADVQDTRDSLLHIKKQAYKELLKLPKVCQQLATYYGNTFTELFNSLPEVNLKKSASYTVLKKCAAVLLALKAIQLNDSLLRKLFEYDSLYKTASYYLNLVLPLLLTIKLQKYSGMIKLGANRGGWSITKGVISNLLTQPFKSTGDVIGSAISAYDDQLGKLRLLGSKDISVDPSAAITAAIIALDKQDDLRMALIDVLADLNTKNFPFRLILAAVHQAVILNPLLLSPRYRLQLKADVKNKLISGGTNQAMQAATATLLKLIAAKDSLLAKNNPASVLKALTAVKGGDKKLELEKLLLPLATAVNFIKALPTNMQPLIDTYLDNIDKLRKLKRDADLTDTNRRILLLTGKGGARLNRAKADLILQKAILLNIAQLVTVANSGTSPDAVRARKLLDRALNAGVTVGNNPIKAQDIDRMLFWNNVAGDKFKRQFTGLAIKQLTPLHAGIDNAATPLDRLSMITDLIKRTLGMRNLRLAYLQYH